MSAQGREPSRIPLTQTELTAGDMRFDRLDGLNIGGRRDVPALINRSFQWWQRRTSLAGSGYAADRWGVTNGGNCTSGTSQQVLAPGDVDSESGYFLRVNSASGSAAGDYTILYQGIENVRRFAGKRVCVRGLMRRAGGAGNVAVELVQIFGSGGSAQASAVPATGPVQPSTLWAPFSVFIDVPSIIGKVIGAGADSYLTLNFWVSAGSTYNPRTGNLGLQTITIDFADLDIFEVAPGYGDQIRPFRQYPFDLDFQRCLRYYETSLFFGVPVNGTSCYQLWVSFAEPKRVTPTLGAVTSWYDYTSSNPNGNFIGYNVTPNGFQPATPTSTWTVGHTLGITWTASAEF